MHQNVKYSFPIELSKMSEMGWKCNISEKDPKVVIFTSNIAKMQWKVLTEQIPMYPVTFLYWVFNIATCFSK